MRAYLAVLFLAGALSALGDSLEGKASRVLAGDRLIVNDGKTKLTVQLVGIKAPVEGQLFFHPSLASLKKLVGKKVLLIEWDKVEDRCRRRPDRCPKVGRVTAGNLDLSLEQVRLGMAWHDIRKLGDQTTPDRTLYSEAEEQARARGLGLWKYKKPLAPWKFAPKSN